MSGYDLIALFLLALLVIGYPLHLRAQRAEQGRRAAMLRHPSMRSRVAAERGESR